MPPPACAEKAAEAGCGGSDVAIAYLDRHEDAEPTRKAVEKEGRRAAQTVDVAPACVFLASPQTSSYITGEILPILGGYGGG